MLLALLLLAWPVLHGPSVSMPAGASAEVAAGRLADRGFTLVGSPTPGNPSAALIVEVRADEMEREGDPEPDALNVTRVRTSHGASWSLIDGPNMAHQPTPGPRTFPPCRRC